MRINNYIPRISAFCIFLTAALPVSAQAENMDTLFDIHHLLAYAVAAFLISVFVMIFYNRLIYYRQQEVNKETERLNAQLGLIMNANQTMAWTFDLSRKLFRLLTGDGQEAKIYSAYEFSQLYDRDDFYQMQKVLTSVQEGENLSETLIMKSALPKDDDGKQRIYEINISVLNRDRHNKPLILLGTQQDITEEQEHSENTKNLMLMYQTVFNSSLVDMIYYNKDGILTDLNDKACETFGVKDRRSILGRKVKSTDIPAYRDLDFRILGQTHMSSITDISHVKKTDERIPEITVQGKMYYEVIIGPVLDKENNYMGIIAAGMDITDMVESNHRQKQARELLEKKTKDIQQYIQNFNYSLKISNVQLMNYYPQTHELEIFINLNQTQFVIPQLRAISLVHPRDRKKAISLIYRMDCREKTTVSETLQTIFKDQEGKSVYLNFNVMPIYDKDNKVSHYFGMCRNDTEMTYTEKRLEEESKKAQEEEQLKNTFLLNMSHELRIPLNAVVGFAELFNSEHSEEDEPVFAEEIKKNTNVLLGLINDILYLSRLDAHMIEYDYQLSDFAMLFDGWCYMGWSNMKPSVKPILENPYSSLMVEIDPQHVGMITQKLCTFSSLTTEEGTVRAKYEYRRGELMITIEDTGKGMDEEELRTAFNRFVHKDENEREGTGLDLPIVKELTEQMHGTIELQSEKDKGNTFFVSIPCKMTSFDKKSDIMI